MPGIFPDPSKGGLIVRNPTTGLPIAQPNVFNAAVPPLPFGLTCDLTAMPEDCNVRPSNSQINAIVSEIINFFVGLSPGREWDCTALDNLQLALGDFVANLAGSGEGSLVCSSAVGDGSEGGAALLYCDGAIVKKLLITGEGSLKELVSAQLCSAEEQAPNTNDDYMLFCRNGVVNKTSAVTFQWFTGEWVQGRSYTTNHMVRKNGRLYSPNAAIPPNTPFVIGTSLATWYEVSPSGASLPYDPANAYSVDTIVSKDGKFYAANDDIPANTPFVVGTTGATWREVKLNEAFINDWNASLYYGKNSVVVKDGVIWRANQPTAPGTWSAAQWDQIGGERNIYRGPWAIGNPYNIFDLVRRNNRLYEANAAIPANTPFVIGQTGATWREVSPSIGTEYDNDSTYVSGNIVSYNGQFFVANGAIPVNTPPTGSGLGLTGATWRPFSVSQLILKQYVDTDAYLGNELFEYHTEIPGQRALFRTVAAGKQPSIFGYQYADVIGERNKFRDDWSVDGNYKSGDVVFAPPAASLFAFALVRANSDMPPGTSFVIGTGALQWTIINSSDLSSLLYDQAKAYAAGQLVITPWGIFRANNDIPSGTSFHEANIGGVTWKSMNKRRPTLAIADASSFAVGDHLDRHLAFTAAGAKTYTINDLNFQDGDMLTGYSINGQLTFAFGNGNVMHSPETFSLRNVDYATFVIHCIGPGAIGSPKEFVLSGDLLAI
jgi:hypothetical protein